VAGDSRLDGEKLVPGSAWRTDGAARLEVPDGAELLVARSGGEIRPATP
jgi:hypothetical protein